MPVRVVVPVPACVSVPLPLMTPATVSASLRLKISVPPLTTSGPAPSVPVVPPLPICSVPALIVVAPV